ncbi:MAG: arginine--tRNA ligase [Solobacterium sp.]|jgi:arginyl-tRNA synthetase|nr:arginine--tRNA ligase [Solobacterium sp.]MCH4223259.1 arginine--tRNA ligase [Solobacterium sp.]MCH4266353.1 arginine--tRNA ligase [Solobacterium sp.]
MSEIEERLKQEFSRAASKALNTEVDRSRLALSLPKEKAHGDYSSNVAMQYAKNLGMKPREAAEKVAAEFDCEAVGAEKIEIAGPGFLNVFMKGGSLADLISKVLEAGDAYGCSKAGKGKKVNVEYVSANPTGDLHPGHARGAAIGDSVTRLMKMAGYDVTREYYVNDAGNQIGKMALSLQARYLQACGKEAEVPEDGYHGQDLIDIANTIKGEIGEKYKDVDPAESLEWFRAYGLKAELKKLQDDLKEFRVEFDVWTSEQSLRDRGLVEQAINQLKAQGYTYEQDGALWLKTTEFKDDKDRVLIKSDGSYTYFTPDIAYHLDKLNRGYDELVDLFGADHHGYIARLKAAIQALGYPADKLHVDIIQMARMIKDGEEFKLSKRSGKAVALRDLLDEAGVDAVRWYFASRAADTQMDFDLDMATKQSNENPVFYAQYAHARMCSVMNKAEGIDAAADFGLISSDKEMTLLKQMGEFESVVADAAATRMPHKMVNFISRFAQSFHSYYNDSKILDPENPELSSQRLALVKACEIVMKNALNSIGVSAPEHM